MNYGMGLAWDLLQVVLRANCPFWYYSEGVFLPGGATRAEGGRAKDWRLNASENL